MGAVAIFATNKRGKQGCLGLAEELVKQLRYRLPLPIPAAAMDASEVETTVEYLATEYGDQWIVTAALRAGAVVHHGDIPQETREVLEALLRSRQITLAICTSTLAEGVNLPIRTLILYSVSRAARDGKRKDMLARDIKNLVGRAGRPGSTTRGLVICVNESQWPTVAPVAKQSPGEPVHGALRLLMTELRNELEIHRRTLTNEFLESDVRLHPLVDGIDMTLMDLTAEEVGPDRLRQVAVELADRTFASSQATDPSKQLLRSVFQLRATRVGALQADGRLQWVRSTGARVRLIDSVASDLLTQRASWDDVNDPLDPKLIQQLLNWAWNRPELRDSISHEFRGADGADVEIYRARFYAIVWAWLRGESFAEIAKQSATEMDDLLGIHTRAVTFALQTLIEQGIALLEKLLESKGEPLSAAVTVFPDHLRYGVPTGAGRVLAANGIRHRRAYVQLGQSIERQTPGLLSATSIIQRARAGLEAYPSWRQALGELVFQSTLEHLRA
jgi:hypothetical protein